MLPQCSCRGGAGTELVAQLLAAGYQVQGLVRSEESAKELAAKGATSFKGDVSAVTSCPVVLPAWHAQHTQIEPSGCR